MIHRYAIRIGGKDRIVELRNGDGEALEIIVDGQPRDVQARQVEPGVWSLMLGRQQIIAQVDGAAPKLTVAIGPPGDPVLVTAEVTEARSAAVRDLIARPAAAIGATATLKAPMPGRVVKILVKVGEALAAAQPAVVVEAMKMENELRAPRAGVVREVRCADGEAVEAGQDLVVIG
ncbi:MAG TPA: biotin/lipoyl-containing protein [Polyangia bacterium]|jgi:biotin carboxyl carrier protein|nr:biotin/lipoyl-containing protein [Polyangia bacterium]